MILGMDGRLEGDKRAMEYEPLKKTTLTEQIMEQIAGMITSGELKPGDRLPNERDLAELFKVTRSRIREALRALSLVGMLTIKPGGGSFVSEAGMKIPEETVMWMYYQEMHKHDEVYAARRLIETEVYLTCFDNKTPEILSKLDEFKTQLLDVDIEGTSSEEFYRLLTEIDTYVGDICGNSIYSRLMQIMVLMRKESAMKVLSLSSSKESAVFYRCKTLNAFHQDDRNKLKKCLGDFFKYSIKEISMH